MPDLWRACGLRLKKPCSMHPHRPASTPSRHTALGARDELLRARKIIFRIRNMNGVAVGGHREESIRPAVYVLRAYRATQRAHAVASLKLRHLEGGVDSVRDLLDVVRIDQQSPFLQLCRGAGELAQDERACF